MLSHVKRRGGGEEVEWLKVNNSLVASVPFPYTPLDSY